jgi:hypothetical protein
MKYFLNPLDGQVYAYDPETQQDLIDNAIASGWEDVTGSWPPPPTPPTDDELKAMCKAEAKTRLENTDYSQLPDVDARLANSAEFTTYRNQVRDLYLNPQAHPVWPTPPTAVWNT